MTGDAITPSTFDATAFGIPFYRVRRIDPTIAATIASLTREHPHLIVDAKLAASDVDGARALWSLGFRKICMQVTLARSLAVVPVPSMAPDVSSRLALASGIVIQHARNFKFDRFSLDPLLPDEGIRRLYANWIENSLSGTKQVVHIDDDFCTLSLPSADVAVAKIDLVSVLRPGRGYGRALVEGACQRAAEGGTKKLLVTTECENTRAWTLYQRCGFFPIEFTSVFHLVLGS